MERYDTFTIRHLYPSEQNPVASNWVHAQVVGSEKYGFKSLVIAPTPYVPSFLRIHPKFSIYSYPHKDIREYKGTSVVRPPFIKIPKILFYSFTQRNLSKAILKGAKNFKAKLIHAHFGYDGVAALPLKRKLSIPMITTFYGGDVKRYVIKKSDLYDELIEEGDLFLGISKIMLKDLEKIGFPKDKMRLWHLGIDVNKFYFDKTRDNRKKDSKKFTMRFLTVARLSKGKGIHHAISAFEKIHKEFPEIEYIIVGFGPYERNLKRMVKEKNLERSVKFINNLKFPNPREVVLENMKNADIFLLPSFSAGGIAREGTPIVLMEAQACGVPCISTDFAGIPEVVLDNKTGFIVPPFDIQKLAEKMAYFIENPSVKEKFARAARKHIEKEFNQELQIQKLVEFYKEFIG